MWVVRAHRKAARGPQGGASLGGASGAGTAGGAGGAGAGALGRPPRRDAALGGRLAERAAAGHLRGRRDLGPGGQARKRARAPSRSRTRRTRRRSCGRACPSAISSSRRSGGRCAGSPDVARGGSRRSPAATSRPTKSSSASGPIGCPAPSRMQVSISAGVHPGPLHQPDGIEEIGEEQAVDDESGLVGDLDRGLAQRRAPVPDPVGRARRAGPSGRHSSTSSIRCTGLNTCRPNSRSGLPLAAARAATESDEVVVARSASGHASPNNVEMLGLGVRVLDDRLDDEVAPRQVCEVGGHLDPVRVAVLELGGEPLGGLLRPPGGGVAARHQADRPQGRGAGGEAAGDRAAAGHRRPLVAGPAHVTSRLASLPIAALTITRRRPPSCCGSSRAALAHRPREQFVELGEQRREVGVGSPGGAGDAASRAADLEAQRHP